MSKVAIMQPYFFPYLGYFQLIAAVDHFIFLDDVNYIKGGWINRNRILLNGTPHFISIPLRDASPHKKICEIEVAYTPDIWLKKLHGTLHNAYCKTPFFKNVFPHIEAILLARIPDIATLTKRSIETVLSYLDIQTRVTQSSADYANTYLKGQERVIDIVKQVNGSLYLNSPGGLALYQPDHFLRHEITLKFLAPYLPAYDQGIPHFIPALSIIDLMMRLPPQDIKSIIFQPVGSA